MYSLGEPDRLMDGVGDAAGKSPLLLLVAAFADVALDDRHGGSPLTSGSAADVDC
jgi:hypothetical protein